MVTVIPFEEMGTSVCDVGMLNALHAAVFKDLHFVCLGANGFDVCIILPSEIMVDCRVRRIRIHGFAVRCCEVYDAPMEPFFHLTR